MLFVTNVASIHLKGLWYLLLGVSLLSTLNLGSRRQSPVLTNRETMATGTEMTESSRMFVNGRGEVQVSMRSGFSLWLLLSLLGWRQRKLWPLLGATHGNEADFAARLMT